MKSIITSYTFNSAAKTVNFSAVQGFDIRKLYAIINVKTEAIIYAVAGTGYTALSGSILTLAYDTTGMSNNDPLLVVYEVDTNDASEATLQQVLAKILTNPATEVTLASVLSKLQSTLTIQGEVTGSFYPATQAISASVLPLPTGAAKETKQDSAITVLGNILTKLSVDPATQATLAAVLAKLSADPATQTTLALVLAKLSSDPATQTTLSAVLAKLTNDPATATAQSTGNNSLNSLDFKTPSLGQKTSANSSPVVIASDQPALNVSVGAMVRPLNNRVSTAVTIGTSSTSVLAADANGYRTIIYVPSTATGSVWLSFGGTAVLAPPSLELTPGSSYQTTDGFPETQAITAISAASQAITVIKY